jgi:hypothetical protein
MLNEAMREVNAVWNFCNEASVKQPISRVPQTRTNRMK